MHASINKTLPVFIIKAHILHTLERVSNTNLQEDCIGRTLLFKNYCLMSKATVQAPSIVRIRSFYYRNVTHSILYKIQTWQQCVPQIFTCFSHVVSMHNVTSVLVWTTIHEEWPKNLTAQVSKCFLLTKDYHMEHIYIFFALTLNISYDLQSWHKPFVWSLENPYIHMRKPVTLSYSRYNRYYCKCFTANRVNKA